MTEGGLKSNRAPWTALLLALAAFGLNVGYFFAIPGKRTLGWVALLATLAALLWAAVGVKRAFARPPNYKGKIAAPVIGVIVLLICGVLLFGWYSSRNLPASHGAPQAGQKAPDFTLAESSGKSTSLAQLLTPAPDAGVVNVSANPPAPKAVLLVFYRGYW